MNADGKRFEVVFISSDQNSKQFEASIWLLLSRNSFGKFTRETQQALCFLLISTTRFNYTIARFQISHIICVIADWMLKAISCIEQEYFATMPWLALPFDSRAEAAAAAERFGIRGIPALVIVDGNGEVINANARGAVLRDFPGGSQFPWQGQADPGG